MSRAAIAELTREKLPKPRTLSRRTFFADESTRIDQGLVAFFPVPSSYTGEDVAELHVHGGRAIREALSRRLADLGLRPAERGEFTRRAVHSGKLDLTQAEAIADLIEAETDAQRRQALSQLDGSLTRLYEAWRARLLQLTALAEAQIDFSDEELPADLMDQLRKGIVGLAGDLDAHLADAHRGEILREGLYLTVIGPPNAGKSSLINALAKRDVAIVAECAGTTRDIIEVRLDLDGYPVVAADTAGLRESADRVESEGVRRALDRSQNADLVLLLLDGTEPAGCVVADLLNREPDLIVWNKVDLPWPKVLRPCKGLVLSLRTGQGLRELVAAISEKVRLKLETHDELPALTRARHRHSAKEALSALGRALNAASAELCAEDLRLASRAIGRITGAVDIEEVLGAIFAGFCIGK